MDTDPSTEEALALPAKLTLSAPIVSAAVVTSGVVEVSLTTALALLPRAEIVIVFASVSESATRATAMVALPSTPIVAVPETAPPTISADSTPVSA